MKIVNIFNHYVSFIHLIDIIILLFKIIVMKICFLDSNPIDYNANDLHSNKIRGAETALINLANNLQKLGHNIFVFNNTSSKMNINGVEWNNLKTISTNHFFDISISNNDIRLFDLVSSNKKIALSHSIQTIEKFIRKKQLLAYLKHRPIIGLLGKYHNKNRNFFLKMFGVLPLEWGVDDIYIQLDINGKNIDRNKCIFTSMKDRNLEFLLNIWIEGIIKKRSSSKLYITPVNRDLKKFNIFNRNFGTKENLMIDIVSSRLCLIPGHKAELFCIAAEEAKELCVPIVSMGIGSLSERIDNGKTGLIASNEKQFAEFTIELMNNDELWSSMRNYMLEMRGSMEWSNITKKFISKLII